MNPLKEITRFVLAFLLFSCACHLRAEDPVVSPSLILDLLYSNNELPNVSKPQYLSPSAMVASPDNKVLYVAEYTGRRIDFINLEKNEIIKSVEVPNLPNGVALSPDGGTLYATCFSPGRPVGVVAVINTATGSVIRVIPAGHSPRAPVLNLKGTILYVCNQFENLVTVIELGTGKHLKRIRVHRQPFAAALTPGGEHLVVANYLPDARADVDTANWAKISLISTVHQKTERLIALAPGAQTVSGVCISPDGKYAYVTHVLSRYPIPTKSIQQGWINSNAISIVDIEKQEFLNVILLDDLGHGAANPWDIKLGSEGSLLLISISGGHELITLDRLALHKNLEGVNDTLFRDFTFTKPFKKRYPLGLKGPRAISVVGNKAYIAGYFSDKIEIFNLSAAQAEKSGEIILGPEILEPIQRRGEFLFSDASICQENWQSCVSCHPESRVDGLNWDNLNDGEGNPKNTKSMLFSHFTPPVMVTGVRDSAEIAVRAGIKFALFSTPREEDATAIDEYLKSLRPVLSPYLVHGKLSEKAKKGKDLFFGKVGCNTCHPPPLYSDLKLHDVGSRGPLDLRSNFDTPILNESWRTAPYLHDGRCRTMRDLLHPDICKHGVYIPLTEQEVDALVEFTNSL